MSKFDIGKTYTRKDIFEILQDVPEGQQKWGQWFTGYLFYKDAFFIFANVGVPGITGRDYPNKWINEGFEWYGKTKTTRQQPEIKKLVSGQYPVHIFIRTDNSAPFKYEGEGSVIRIEDTSPVKIIWQMNTDVLSKQDAILKQIESVDENYSYIEGKHRVVCINRYERDSDARRRCIEHFGVKCFVCGFDFEKMYGNIGKNYIHVHHKIPLSTIKQEYQVNPIKDLIPICPNCHSMVHSRIPPLDVKELKKATRPI